MINDSSTKRYIIIVCIIIYYNTAMRINNTSQLEGSRSVPTGLIKRYHFIHSAAQLSFVWVAARINECLQIASDTNSEWWIQDIFSVGGCSVEMYRFLIYVKIFENILTNKFYFRKCNIITTYNLNTNLHDYTSIKINFKFS